MTLFPNDGKGSEPGGIMPSTPTISVLMSVYNGEAFLRGAVESILQQTYRDFELLIIDDGSADASIRIAEEMRQRDERIIIIQNDRNLGLPGSLNRGLELMRGKYVARHDADDVSGPQRLEKQLAYLEARPEVGVLGTSMRVFTKKADFKNDISPVSQHNGIAWNFFWGHGLAHPTILARREAFEAVGGYDPECLYAEDIDLWLRMLGKVRFANLSEALYDYRIHPDSTCRSKRAEQVVRVSRLREHYVREKLGLAPPAGVFDWPMRTKSSGSALSAREFKMHLDFAALLAESLEERRMLLAGEQPGRMELVTETALALAQNLAAVDEKHLLRVCRSFLPGWTFHVLYICLHPFALPNRLWRRIKSAARKQFR